MSQTYLFGPFRLEVRERRLTRGGEPVHLKAKAFETLRVLLENHGRLVLKEELMRAVWPDAVVEENNLDHNISALRKALGQKTTGEMYIETVPRQGYRFVADVQETAGANGQPELRTAAVAGAGPSPVSAPSSGAPIPASQAALVASGASRTMPPSAVASHIAERDAELQRLAEHLRRAEAGSRQIVFVTGESGLGKTTLVTCFTAQAASSEGLLLALGHCVEHRGEGEPYMPVLEALGRLCREHRVAPRVLSMHAPSWLVQMPALLGADELTALKQRMVGVTRDRMLREAVEALEALASVAPLVLVLEDLHWADHSTLDLIEYLARRPEPARLLVVGTYRPADARSRLHPIYSLTQELKTRGYCTEIPLAFLSEAGVAACLKARFPGAVLPRDLARVVRQRTDGNPLFLSALLNAWVGGRLAERDAGGKWAVHGGAEELASGIPDTLRSLIEQQLQRLGREQQDILGAAAVAGTEFSAALVAAALDRPLEQAEDECAQLAEHGQFLQAQGGTEWPDGTLASAYAFTHGLYHEVIYDRLPAGRRVRLHQQIGTRLEQAFGERCMEVAPELAAHFLQARDARRAAIYCRMAAEHALQRSAHHEAILHLTRAQEAIGRLADERERAERELAVLAMLGPALVATRGFADPRAEDAFRRAYELSQDLQAHRFPVVFGLASMYELRGEYPKCEALVARHLPDATCVADFIPEAQELMACSLFHQGNFQLSLEHAQAGAAAYHDIHSPLLAPAGENPGVGCQYWAAFDLWFLGLADRAVETARHAHELAQRPGYLYSLANAKAQFAMLYQFRQEPEEALAWALDAVSIATEQGFAFRRAIGEVVEGWALARLGRYEEGLRILREGIAGCDAAGASMDRPYYLALLAEAYLAARALDDACRSLHEAASQLARTTRSFFYDAELKRLEGVLRLAQGGPDAAQNAEACFERSLEIARAQSALPLQLRASVELAKLWIERGRCNDGVRLVQETLGAFTEGFDTPDVVAAQAMVKRQASAGA